MNIENLVRPNIAQLKPYRSARQDHSGGILLDANENAFGSPVFFDDLELNRYPDPYQSGLRERVATMIDAPGDTVFIGAGSDEIIDLLFRVFCEPSVDNVVIPEPTYGMYRVAAGIHNVSVSSSLLNDDFQLDVADIVRQTNERTKMIFCCSPNNPTGNVFSKEDIFQLCTATDALIIVDEAYIEFAGSPSLAGYVAEHPNLVVMRTLSKSWGLAGIRIGYCIAHPTIIEYLNKVKAPYNVNSVSAALALKAFEESKERERIIHTIREERKRLVKRLKKLPPVQHIYPSDANFLLVRVNNAKKVYSGLINEGIVIRDRSNEPKLDNCVRITVGTPEQNDALIKAMEEIGE